MTFCSLCLDELSGSVEDIRYIQTVDQLGFVCFGQSSHHNSSRVLGLQLVEIFTIQSHKSINVDQLNGLQSLTSCWTHVSPGGQ